MEKEYIYIAELFYKKELGILTEEESTELNNWIAKMDPKDEIIAEVRKTISQPEYSGSTHKMDSWIKIESRISKNKLRSRFHYFSITAAAAMLVIGLVIFFYEKQTDRLVADNIVEIPAGINKAILHLGNGQKIALAETSPDSLLKNALPNATVETHNSTLTYNDNKQQQPIDELNTLEIPRGGEYKLILSDGTKVWLNADTKLTFPVAFNGNTRRVVLNGEGYFEVKKDPKRAFIVSVNNMDVKVLGTSFNVKSFRGGARSIATLLNGSVEIITKNKKVVLRPDQQATLDNSTENVDIKEVDASDYAAWTRNKFVFRNEKLETILTDISRWYDVALSYEDQSLRELIFSGAMDRYTTLNETLSMLERTNKVSFRIENRTIIIKPFKTE